MLLRCHELFALTVNCFSIFKKEIIYIVWFTQEMHVSGNLYYNFS